MCARSNGCQEQARMGRRILSSADCAWQGWHFKYVVNQDLCSDKTIRGNEQIRQAAEEAFIWADSSETLRKALIAKSRSPQLECLFEGAMHFGTLRTQGRDSRRDCRIRRHGMVQHWLWPYRAKGRFDQACLGSLSQQAQGGAARVCEVGGWRPWRRLRAARFA